MFSAYRFYLWSCMSNPPRMAASRLGGISMHRLTALLGCIALLGVGAPAATCAEEANVALRPAPSLKLLPRFPDFGQMPPASKYQGRIFKLSQDYPARKPAIEPA